MYLSFFYEKMGINCRNVFEKAAKTVWMWLVALKLVWCLNADKVDSQNEGHTDPNQPDPVEYVVPTGDERPDSVLVIWDDEVMINGVNAFDYATNPKWAYKSAQEFKFRVEQEKKEEESKFRSEE